MWEEILLFEIDEKGGRRVKASIGTRLGASADVPPIDRPLQLVQSHACPSGQGQAHLSVAHRTSRAAF